METKPEAKSHFIPWSGIGRFITALSLIVLITAFYFAFYRISLLGKQLENSVTALQGRMEGIQANIDNVQQSLRQSTDVMNQSLNEMKQTLSGNKDLWRIIEAQYYVKLADIKLQYENNIPIAIQLLQTADQEIHDLNEPNLDPARKQLAEDIITLQGIAPVDYTGLYMRLSALDEQVSKLPMLVKHSESNVNPPVVNNNEPWWKRGLQDTWASLQKIIIVRYRASGVPPLVTPEEQDFLVLNLHAMFQKAMWAVLNKQNEVYKASLQQAAAWITQYYVVDSPLTQSMLGNLNQLQQIDVHPAVPRVTASLQAFNDYFVNGNKK